MELILGATVSVRLRLGPVLKIFMFKPVAGNRQILLESAFERYQASSWSKSRRVRVMCLLDVMFQASSSLRFVSARLQ
jgi:hypothetical protein